jgi:hypothetical protein
MNKDEFASWVKADNAMSDSVGLLANESENFIVLLQSIGENQVADGVKIARSAIKTIKELGELPLDLIIP